MRSFLEHVHSTLNCCFQILSLLLCNPLSVNSDSIFNHFLFFLNTKLLGKTCMTIKYSSVT